MARFWAQNERAGVRVALDVDGDRASAKCLNCHWRIDANDPIPVTAAIREAELHVDYFPHPEVPR